MDTQQSQIDYDTNPWEDESYNFVNPEECAALTWFGCDEPDYQIDVLVTILGDCENSANNISDFQRISSKLECSEAIYYMLAQLLGEKDLIEYGVSIRYFWLNKRGKAFLNELRKWQATKNG